MSELTELRDRVRELQATLASRPDVTCACGAGVRFRSLSAAGQRAEARMFYDAHRGHVTGGSREVSGRSMDVPGSEEDAV